MKKKFLYSAIAALMIFPAISMAEEIEEDIIKTLDEVVVTGSRFEDKLSSVPANITVIDLQDIENSTAENIPELLRTQVGVQVVDIAGNRRKYRVDIRGFGETSQSNTLVLVDGRRINQADLSGTDWSLIPLERVERIEIVRGGRGSVLYGDNSSGGVVNIITKEAEKNRINGRILVGSYDTYSGGLSYSGSTEKLSWFFAGNYLTSDGYRDNSDTESGDLGMTFGYYPSNNMRINLRGDFHKDDTGLPGALRASDFADGIERTATLHPDDFADTKDYFLSVTPEIYFSTDSVFIIEASLRQRDFFSFASFVGGSFEGDTEINTLTVSPQLVFREKLLGLENSLTLGVDYINSKEDIHNKSIYFGFPSEGYFNLKKINIGIYIQDDIAFSDKLSLSAGFRHDRADFEFNPSTPDKIDMDENLLTVGLNYLIYEDIQLYGSYSQSFRYPLFDEFFSFYTNTVSTSLVNQTSDDYEVGLRYGINKNFYGNINLFRIETDNEIYLNPVTFTNENLDGVSRRDGVEVTLTWTYDKVSLRGGYTYTDATFKNGQFSGNNVPGVPKHMANLETWYQFPLGFSAALIANYIGKRPFESDFPNAFPNQEDYVLMNAKFTYKHDTFSGFLNLNNLLNEEYSEYGVLGSYPVEPAFYPSPEFNVVGGVTFSF